MKDAQRQPDKVLLEPGVSGAGIPIWLAPMSGCKGHLAHLPREQLGWLDANGFDGMPRRHVLLPGAGGTVSCTHRVGRWRTAYLLLSGRPLPVSTAVD